MMWNPLAYEASRADQAERSRWLCDRAPRRRDGRGFAAQMTALLAHARDNRRV